MNKELFIEGILKIEELYNKGEVFSNLLSKMDTDSNVVFNIYSDAISYIENILRLTTEDIGDNIGYYLWELNFGKDYKDGCISYDDGTIIKLSNPEELWEAIQKDKNR